MPTKHYYWMKCWNIPDASTQEVSDADAAAVPAGELRFLGATIRHRAETEASGTASSAKAGEVSFNILPAAKFGSGDVDFFVKKFGQPKATHFPDESAAFAAVSTQEFKDWRGKSYAVLVCIEVP